MNKPVYYSLNIRAKLVLTLTECINITKNDEVTIKIDYANENQKNIPKNMLLKEIKANYKEMIKSIKDPAPDIMESIFEIIPFKYFGSSSNKTRFRNIVKRIVTQTFQECIHLCVLYEYFDYRKFGLWLNESKPIKAQVLEANLYLLQYIVKPFIRHYYKMVGEGHSKLCYLVPIGEYQLFCAKVLKRAIQDGYLEKMRMPLNKDALILGHLFFSRKGNNNYRAICRPVLPNKIFLKDLKRTMYQLIQKYTIDGGSMYRKWVEYTLKNPPNNSKYYGIQLDLTDAFGNVDTETVKNFIVDCSTFFEPKEKAILINLINHQYVHCMDQKTVYRWKHGLLQGYPILTLLAEFYISFECFKHLRYFLKPRCFLQRKVDDFLYISTERKDILEFEAKMNMMFKLNEKKTIKYVPNEPNEFTGCEFLFCGYKFYIPSMRVTKSYKMPENLQLRGRFKFWNKKKNINQNNTKEFIMNNMRYSSVNAYFSKLILNTKVNCVSTVIYSIFKSMIFIAFKFFYVIDSIDYLLNTAEKKEIIFESIIAIGELYSRLILKTMKVQRGEFFKMFFWSEDLIVFLWYRAIIRVLGRRNAKYLDIINRFKILIKTKRFRFDNIKSVINFVHFNSIPGEFDKVVMNRVQLAWDSKYE